MSFIFTYIDLKGREGVLNLCRNWFFLAVLGKTPSDAIKCVLLDERDVMNKVKLIIGTEEMHQRYWPALRKWRMIEEMAEFICVEAGDEPLDNGELFHFRRQFDKYAQFTSPLRRYMDLVVHRLVLASLSNAATPPYTGYEI